MAAFRLLPPSRPSHFFFPHSNFSSLSPPPHFKILPAWFLAHTPESPISLRASTNGGVSSSETELPKPARRGRKKSVASPASSSSTTKKPRKSRSRSGNKEENEQKPPAAVEGEEDDDYDDDMDFPYPDPPLVCCFGAVQKDFVPTTFMAPEQMHPDIYSHWKTLQWRPPGPPSYVAISHVRLGGRAAFMGKVGDDEFGEKLVLMMNKENVQTRAVKFDKDAKTACSYMKVKFEDGRLMMDMVKECAEYSLLSSEVNLDVLKEARIFHFNSEVLTSPSMHSALFKAISLSKKFGGLIFFDLNLPLPLWRSRNETRKVIKKACEQADIIEVTRQELEFLLDEDYYEKKRNHSPQYYVGNFEQTKSQHDYYHYTREEVSPLWHDGMKFLFVTDGTLRIHYYAPSFDGVIVGTEDVLITPFSCDTTGSGDAVVAAIMRKLTSHPEIFENQDSLERLLPFAVAPRSIS